MNEKNIFYNQELGDEESYRKVLKELVEAALQHTMSMKEKEGRVLQEDILKRLAFLEAAIEEIADKSPQATQKYYGKLKQRLSDLFSTTPENEERLLREVAIYAEKVDISEEILRFKSHLEQFFHYLRLPQETPGKTLDFLIQELNREINTIGAKSSDVVIAHLVVNIKSELEKIREQIQNVE